MSLVFGRPGKIMRYLLIIATLIGLSACQKTLPPKDPRMAISGHIDEAIPEKSQIEQSIPPVVSQLPIISAPKPVEKAAPAKLSIVHPETMMTADKPAVLRRATRTNWADAVESDDDSEDDFDHDAWEDSYAMSMICEM